MQNPIKDRETTTKSILVSIVVMVLGAIAIYFLKFFGFSIQATLKSSIMQTSNSELYANIILVLAICLSGLGAFVVSLLIWGKDYYEILRKNLGAFLIEENERIGKEKEDLIKQPQPADPAKFFQMKEQSRFLDGQFAIVERLSKWLFPPDYGK